MKQCTSCLVTKERSDFYIRYTSKDGLYSICKECQKSKTAENKKKQVPCRTVSVPDRCVPAWLTDGDWQEIKATYMQALDLTAKTGTRFVVDHIYPLRGKEVSGLHVPSNLRVVPESVNRTKYNKVLDTGENWV